VEETDLTYEGIETAFCTYQYLFEVQFEETDLTYEGIETPHTNRYLPSTTGISEETDLTYEGIETCLPAPCLVLLLLLKKPT